MHRTVYCASKAQWEARYLPLSKLVLVQAHQNIVTFQSYWFYLILFIVCSCGLNVETNTQFFLYYHFLVIKYAPSWAQLTILIVLWQILTIRYWLIFFILGKVLYISAKTLILNVKMNYIISTKKFEESIF